MAPLSGVNLNQHKAKVRRDPGVNLSGEEIPLAEATYLLTGLLCPFQIHFNVAASTESHYFAAALACLPFPLICTSLGLYSQIKSEF